MTIKKTIVSVRLSNTELAWFDCVSKPEHPTQKPLELLEYLIRTYTRENETVLDNTMGSGSTGVACVNTNRNFIGMELEEKYFKIAEHRIDEQNENGGGEIGEEL